MNDSRREKEATISDMTDQMRSADPILVEDSEATKTLDVYIYIFA